MDKNEAIEFLNSLVRGFDPFTGVQLPDDSAFNDIKYVRAFYELKSFIEAISNKNNSTKKNPFIFKTKEGIVSGPSCISNFINKINEANVEENMKPFSRKPVQKWLLDNGYIAKQDGKTIITQKGQASGIYYELREVRGATIRIVMYPKDLLIVILDLIESGYIS